MVLPFYDREIVLRQSPDYCLSCKAPVFISCFSHIIVSQRQFTAWQNFVLALNEVPSCINTSAHISNLVYYHISMPNSNMYSFVVTVMHYGLVLSVHHCQLLFMCSCVVKTFFADFSNALLNMTNTDIAAYWQLCFLSWTLMSNKFRMIYPRLITHVKVCPDVWKGKHYVATHSKMYKHNIYLYLKGGPTCFEYLIIGSDRLNSWRHYIS